MPNKYYLLFAAALLLLSVFFDYHQIIPQPPRATHTWRQADGAALAANYYRDDLKFFKPRIYNLQTGGNGHTAGEFTITYWLAGLCYKIFGGINEGFLRVIHLLIFFGGLFGLFRMTHRLLDSLWLAFCLPLLFFAAPILTFYGNNFLPDVPAFGCLLMGWAAFFTYLHTRRSRSFWWAFACFALAGLLKLTMLMSVMALGAVFVLEWLGWVDFSDYFRYKSNVKKILNEENKISNKYSEKLFPQPLKTLLGFGLVVFLIGAWYAYLLWYKQHHGNDYFLSKLNPIWSKEDMNYLIYGFYRTLLFWSKYYFFPLVNILLLLLTAVVFLGRRSPGKLLYALCFFTFAGGLSIYFLWFYQFIDHDYYMVSFYIYPVFLLLAGLMILKRHFSHIYTSLSFKMLTIALVLVSLFYSKATMQQRYGGSLDYQINPQLAEADFHQYMNELGISKDDWVISVPDGSPNASLCLLDRPGFSEWIDRTGSRPDSAVIMDWRNRGAKYLIVNQLDYLNKPAVQPFLPYQMGAYKEIRIFDLRSVGE